MNIVAFEAVTMREDCEKGFFVSFEHSNDALQEMDAFFKRPNQARLAATLR